jgi:hypothetical protein
MSIFEPIPRESGMDERTHELDEVDWDVDSTPAGGSFDPRSIWIAGLVVSGIVGVGLVVSNSAEPEAQQRSTVASRVDPGAAAVEQAEVKQSVPTAGPTASASVELVDEDGTDSDEAPTWQEPEDSSDDAWSGDSSRDDKPDKPGKGRGHGRD